MSEPEVESTGLLCWGAPVRGAPAAFLACQGRVKSEREAGFWLREPLCCGRNDLEGAAPFIGFQESFQTSSRLACCQDLYRLGDPQLDSPESGMLLHSLFLQSKVHRVCQKC